ncbi:hypothetical protein ERJ75_000474100 [Trypanosoma vivax]|nr:hypothetical protein TRVL_09895 [Trypanosoma vivax]KAH8616483.1 hypothetical protein ERJ75_000474100 [Trypanosoma vivax]
MGIEAGSARVLCDPSRPAEGAESRVPDRWAKSSVKIAKSGSAARHVPIGQTSSSPFAESTGNCDISNWMSGVNPDVGHYCIVFGALSGATLLVIAPSKKVRVLDAWERMKRHEFRKPSSGCSFRREEGTQNKPRGLEKEVARGRRMGTKGIDAQEGGYGALVVCSRAGDDGREEARVWQ